MQALELAASGRAAREADLELYHRDRQWQTDEDEEQELEPWPPEPAETGTLAGRVQDIEEYIRVLVDEAATLQDEHELLSRGFATHPTGTGVFWRNKLHYTGGPHTEPTVDHFQPSNHQWVPTARAAESANLPRDVETSKFSISRGHVFYPLRMRFERYFLRDLSIRACRGAQTASLKCKAHLLKV